MENRKFCRKSHLLYRLLKFSFVHWIERFNTKELWENILFALGNGACINVAESDQERPHSLRPFFLAISIARLKDIGLRQKHVCVPFEKFVFVF